MSRELRLLLLTANPKGTTPLRLDEEAREIENGLRRSILGTLVDVRSQWAVRPREVRRALLDYDPDIVHFSGHGIGDEGLIFENETGELSVVPTDALASLFELFSESVKCVLLNACYSEVQAKAVAKHIQHVVGMHSAIGDQAAIEFAIGFYDALGAGKSVPVAYRFGCNAIRLMGLTEHSTPVLLTKQCPQLDHFSSAPHSQPQRIKANPTRGNKDSLNNQLTVASIDDVVQWGWDGIKLLENLISLDYETIDGLTHAHEGEPEQWGPVFMTHPETWRLLTIGPKAIVGYWHWAPLFQDEYGMAKNGALLDSMITVDTVQHFELPGVYDLYFVQICMLPEYRRPHAIQKLFDTVFEVLENLSQSSIFVREITANAYTPAGDALCKGFNMSFACPHQEHGSIYVAPIKDILGHPVAKHRVGLQRQYKAQGLL